MTSPFLGELMCLSQGAIEQKLNVVINNNIQSIVASKFFWRVGWSQASTIIVLGFEASAWLLIGSSLLKDLSLSVATSHFLCREFEL